MRTITSGTDDSGKSYVQNGNAKITSDTDDFGRTTKINTKLGDNPKFSVNYTYQNVLDENNQTTNRTTNKVDEMTYKLGEGENAAQIVKYSKQINIESIDESIVGEKNNDLVQPFDIVVNKA